jgi:pimeloyl-ACP methyl ester carboxylesterase
MALTKQLLASSPAAKPDVAMREHVTGERSRPAPTLPALGDWYVDVNDMRIHYLKAGSVGRPVLLLHGGGLDAAGMSLRKTIPVLAEQHRVLAPDWPGFGQSDAMPTTWRVEECVDFVGSLLDTIGLERVILIGVSMALLGGSRTFARRNLGAALVNREQVLSDEMLDEVISLARRAGAGAAFRQLLRSEYQWRGLRTNYRHRLPEVKVPTLLVHGIEDRIVPVGWAERAHRLMQNSKIEIIPDCGHLPPVEQPDLFNRVIRSFLTESYSSHLQVL